MALTLLAIVQTACSELGLPAPSAVVSSTDLQVKQLLALVNRDGDALRRMPDNGWTVCQFEYNIPIGAPIITTGNTTNLSPIITNIPSTAGIVANNYVVAGSDLPSPSRVISVDSATQVTLNMEATGTNVDTPLTFALDTYPEPQGFDHFIGQTWWDRTNRWSLLGPDSPQEDQWHRSGIVTTGPRRHFRQIGPYTSATSSVASTSSNYRLWPPPSAQDTPFQLVFEYASKNWVMSQAGAFQTSFLADTDVPLLDDQALILGCKWRMWQIKQFDYAALQAEYVDYVNQLAARDGGSKTLSLAKRLNSYLISPAQVQDGYFPARSD